MSAMGESGHCPIRVFYRRQGKCAGVNRVLHRLIIALATLTIASPALAEVADKEPSVGPLWAWAELRQNELYELCSWVARTLSYCAVVGNHPTPEGLISALDRKPTLHSFSLKRTSPSGVVPTSFQPARS